MQSQVITRVNKLNIHVLYYMYFHQNRYHFHFETSLGKFIHLIFHTNT